MGPNPFRHLAWLPAPPPDFSTRFASAANAAGDGSDLVRELAGFALDDNQLSRLSGLIDRRRRAGDPLASLEALRLGIVSSSTTNFLCAALAGTAPRHGLRLECIEAGFDQAMQSALDPRSSVQAARPDFILIALDPHWIHGVAQTASGEAAAAALRAVRQMLAGFRAGCGATCIVQTIARAPEDLFGSFDRCLPWTRRAVADAFNRGLAAIVVEEGAILADIAALAENVGLGDWHDPALWHLAKAAVAQECLPAYAETICRVLAAARGKSRKCAVFDLDNTLWGGVVGDDGVEGIAIGCGDAAGEAHLELQRLGLELHRRGVVLAICSKNDDAIARRALREHPGMLLREEHFAVLQANWTDKAANLRAIAQALSLGLEALVFVDDNPAERAWVRRELPAVAVPELPDDPALYARWLSAAGYFEAIAYSAEDASRGGAYAQNARRAELRGTSADLGDYLRSLRMEIRFAPFDGTPRIAQLINKSNQFNLTTRRYTEAQVAQMGGDCALHTLQVWLADAFGDNGMIGVVICRKAAPAWEIDTWLMSCRVLGRRVEEATLAAMVEAARREGASRLVGLFVPSGRNALVEHHYARLGFTSIEHGADGGSRWELALDGYSAPDLPFVVRSG